MTKDLGEGTVEDKTKIEEGCEDGAREKINCVEEEGRRFKLPRKFCRPPCGIF